MSVTAEILGGKPIDTLAPTDDPNNKSGCTYLRVRTVLTQSGAYQFGGMFAGYPVQITASKPGYVTRQRTFTPLANLASDPQFNRLDFGGKNPELALTPTSP